MFGVVRRNLNVIKGTRIKEEFFFSSMKFNTAELLKLLSNGSNKAHRRRVNVFEVGNSVELLELPSNRRNKDGRRIFQEFKEVQSSRTA